MSKPLKILKAEINNFKDLKPMEIDFGGRSMMVIGPNESSKSSLIQAIMSPLNSKYKPLEPINKDEERASVELTIGNDSYRYHVEMYFSQEKKSGRLVLKDDEGANIPSPKAALEAIIGNISFDIDEFVRLSKTDSGTLSKAGIKKQIEILKSLMDDETKKRLHEIDVQKKELTDQKNALAAEIKVLTNQAEHDFTDEFIKNYETPIDTGPIEKKIEDIGKTLENWTYINNGVQEKKKWIEEAKKMGDRKDYKHNLDATQLLIESIKRPKSQEAVTLLAHVASYREKMVEALETIERGREVVEDVEKGEKWLEKNPKPTTEKLMENLKEAQGHNLNSKVIASKKEMLNQVNLKKQEVENLDGQIKEAENKKKEVFASHPLPVKHLSFDEEQVLYKDLPFDSNQHPSSTIIGVGVKIAMAMNPNLRVIVIKDGSLLDKKLANGILKMIEKEGYQLLIEMVSWEGEEMEVKFIEKEI